MRYLNKIVFINSAHIPYAEVNLDGNVHLIGNQGAGKSTVLRALLFFYNADKLKLGIPREKKSFDAFYFDKHNSYIVYEVVRETGRYFIVAFRHAGRVAYRFVDTAYDRSYFMDDDNRVFSDWWHIRGRIPEKVYISGIVDHYDTFRDIIFGNNAGLPPAYRKFSIAESSRYQNIPRTIQNVFLNSRLDADFIKQTIIRSLTEAEEGIDLGFYRHAVEEFGQQYADIEKWFHKEKSGRVRIQDAADKVIDAYRNILFSNGKIITLGAQFKFAMRRDSEVIPSLEAREKLLLEEKQRVDRLIADEEKSYRSERDSLQRSLGTLEAELANIRVLQKKYASMDIPALIRRIEAEGSVKAELDRQESVLDGLTKAYENVRDKYKRLSDTIRQTLRDFETEQRSRLQDLREKIVSEQSRADDALRFRDEKTHAWYDEASAEADAAILAIREEEARVKENRVRIGLSHPYGDKLATLEEKKRNLEAKVNNLSQKALSLGVKIDSLIHEEELKEKDISSDGAHADEVFVRELAALQKQLESLEALLRRSKGSLLGWLQENRLGWEENIGKVAGEQVLYSAGLNPQLGQDRESLYGVRLDLDSLERQVRTPRELEAEKANLEIEINEMNARRAEAWNSCQDAIDKLKKDYSARIRVLREEKHAAEAENAMIPSQLAQIEMELAQTLEAEKAWRESESAKVEAALAELSSRRDDAGKQKEELLRERDKRIQESLRQRDARKKELDAALQSQTEEISAQTHARQKDTSAELERLKVQETTELSGQGADVVAIGKLEAAIDRLRDELSFITSKRKDYFDYLKDKEDHLDKEEETKEKKKAVQAKQDSLDRRHQTTAEKHQAQKADNDKKLQGVTGSLQELRKGLEDAHLFLDDTRVCPQEVRDVPEEESREDLPRILNELKSFIFDRTNRREELRSVTNSFKGNFSARNTFKFRTELFSDDDYMNFAADLSDFVENDKISTYSERVSHQYEDILQRISKEVGDLTSRSSEVSKTIGEINADFRERNFAGVIKDISLRWVSSEDPLMQLLVKIRDFTLENSFGFGAVNLFSTEEDRGSLTDQTIQYLKSLQRQLEADPQRHMLDLGDTFALQFRVIENDNDTGWTERVSTVGSDGTDVLVKAMVNIMLLNVFKRKASKKFGDFCLHCMMDEIGRLHPRNVRGILQFAGSRNIWLVNGSPTTYDVGDYKYTYALDKDADSNTRIIPLIAIHNARETE